MKKFNLDNGRYLLACSFGPDSMALFDMLEKSNIEFDVSHVNYSLREEADEETSSLKEYCKKKNIKLFIKKVTVNKSKNIEDECRKIRYEFFKELNDQNRYDAVLVAHNLDDNLETYIMQKLRKNIVKTYGISEKTVINGVNIIRPLLSYRKNELLNYCNENKVPYCIDSSNNKDEYLRNRIRHNIVSKLSDDEINKYLEEIALKNKIEDDIKDKLSKLNLSKQENLISLDDESFIRAINILVSKADKDLRLGRRTCLSIKKLLLSSNNNVITRINKKVYFKNEYGEVSFLTSLPEVSYLYVINSPRIIDTDYFYFDLKDELENHNLSISDFPLTIRTFCNGDKYRVKDYECKVNRLFIDWKMPKDTRKYWPIIVNNVGVIKYIPRYRKDFDLSSSKNFYVKIQ